MAEINLGGSDWHRPQIRASTVPYVVELIKALSGRVDSLVLDNNPLMDDGCLLLLDAFDELRTYKNLSLVSVGLNPEGVINFLAPFAHGSALQSLKLGSTPSAERRNRFSEDSSRFMGEFLVQCHSLKTLDFSNTQLRSANGVYMFSAINGRSSLQELILANTGVSNQAIQQLCVKK